MSSSTEQYGQSRSQQGVPPEQVRTRDLLAATTRRLSIRLAATAQSRRDGRGFQPGGWGQNGPSQIGEQPGIVHQLRQRIQTHGANGQWRIQVADRPWTLTADEQSEWPFGKGTAATIFQVLALAEARAPGAAIGLGECLAKRRYHPEAAYARDLELIVVELPRILARFTPDETTLDLAWRHMQRMQQLSQLHPDNRDITLSFLTAKYGFFEQVYGLRARNRQVGYSDEELYVEFAALEDGLRRAGSVGKRAYVLSVQSDILLQSGRVEEANRALFEACALLGAKFPDVALSELLDTATSPIARQVKEEVMAGQAAGQQHAGQPRTQK